MKSEVKGLVFLVLFVVVGATSQFLFTSSGNPLAWGVGFPLFLFSLYLFNGLSSPPQFPSGSGRDFSSGAEMGILCVLGVLILFFGFFGISSNPPGLFIDQGAMGLDALRLLRGHQLPPLQLNFLHHPPLAIYGLAGWFSFFSPTAFSLQAFFILLSISGLSIYYRFFQSMGGKALALVGLALLGIMRWHFMTARCAFPSILVPFFTFAVLVFWWKALRTQRGMDFLMVGVLMGASLYTYQSLKVLPVFLFILFLYEKGKKHPGARWNRATLMGGAFIVVAFPILLSWVQQGSLGTRESELWIGNEIAAQKSLAPLFKNLADWALMFNRLEVPYPCMGILGHRLLDDVTSFLFWIGFFYALWNWKDRVCFYTLSGLLVMSLPMILASDYLGFQRIVGAAPFVSILAALPVIAILRGARERLGRFQRITWLLLAMGFAFAIYQNFDVYFQQQTGDRTSWKSFMPEATRVGEEVISRPGVLFELTPYFWGHETVKFICYDQARRIQLLTLKEALKPDVPLNEKICFVLEDGKEPTLELLKKVYPGGMEEEMKDPWGFPMAYFYYWDPASQGAVRPADRRGLLGRYFVTGNFSGVPSAVRWDPIVNFTNLGDFPLPGPLFSAQWNGVLNAPQKGKYGFLVLATDHERMLLDDRQVIEKTGAGQTFIELTKGPHRIELFDERANLGEVRADLHLLWRPPGRSQFSIVPSSAFGIVKTPK